MLSVTKNMVLICGAVQLEPSAALVDMVSSQANNMIKTQCLC